MSLSNSDKVGMGCLGMFILSQVGLVIFYLLLSENDNQVKQPSVSVSETRPNQEFKTEDFSSNVEDLPKPKIDPIVQDSIELVNRGYYSTDIENGEEPDCYNYSPDFDYKLDNELRVYVGSGTDVAIKIMNIGTDNCIRYFFVNSKSLYSVKNIPQGKYYLKIAYGKRWMMMKEDSQCKGRFLRNPDYEKGEDILDYNVRMRFNSYEIPSYELRLDVIASRIENSFNSYNIDENEFNL